MECSLVPPRLRLDARRAQLEHVLGDDHGAAPAGRGEGVRLALVRLPRVQIDDLVAVDLRSPASSAPTRLVTLKSVSAPDRASFVNSLMKSPNAMIDTIHVRTIAIHSHVLTLVSKAPKISLKKRKVMSVVVALLIFSV